MQLLMIPSPPVTTNTTATDNCIDTNSNKKRKDVSITHRPSWPTQVKRRCLITPPLPHIHFAGVGRWAISFSLAGYDLRHKKHLVHSHTANYTISIPPFQCVNQSALRSLSRLGQCSPSVFLCCHWDFLLGGTPVSPPGCHWSHPSPMKCKQLETTLFLEKNKCSPTPKQMCCPPMKSCSFYTGGPLQPCLLQGMPKR
jgi:hypothetical protein